MALLRNLWNMNFKLKYVEEFSCNAKVRMPDSEIQPLFLSYQCGFKNLRQASFAEPEIGVTPSLVASHTTVKAVGKQGRFAVMRPFEDCIPPT